MNKTEKFELEPARYTAAPNTKTGAPAGTQALDAERIRLLKFLPVFNTGGTETQVLNLIRRIDHQRFDIRFSCMKKWGDLLEEVERESTAIDEYPIMHLYGLNAFRKELQFSRMLAGQHVQIMHSYNFYANTFAIPAARFARVPAIVASVRSFGLTLSPLQWRVQRMVCRLADRVVVNAGAIRDWLEERGFPERKLSVIHNGVDVAKFSSGEGAAIRREFGVPENAPLVVMIARLNSQKGEGYLLEAAPRILGRCPGTHFLLAGGSYTRGHDDERKPDTAYLDRLKQRARAAGVGANVHLTGMRKDIPDILAASTVSILPSFSEGISNTVLESMAAGVPVVATRVGGTPEIVCDDRYGILIPPRDAEAIVEAVSSVIQTPSLAERLSAAGRARVDESFSLDVMVQKMEELYLGLLASKVASR